MSDQYAGIPRDAVIYVAGHRGLVGSAICRRLTEHGYERVVTRTSAELDLTRQEQAEAFFDEVRPDHVILAAAKVGGIHANNTYPADFIYRNLAMEANVIQAAHAAGVNNLLLLGSSCIYPKHAPQPMPEDCLLTGPLEPTNEPYAVAKIAGIKLCESYNRQYGRNYRSVMPTNLYGPGDNFHAENAHVMPALIRRFHEAKMNKALSVSVWGTGTPLREFLHVDDMADASLFVLGLDDAIYCAHTEPMLSHINVGSGAEVSISELANTIAEVVGYEGEILFDLSKPDGAPRKLLDCSKLADMGWRARVGLREGVKGTYLWFLDNQEYLRAS